MEPITDTPLPENPIIPIATPSCKACGHPVSDTDRFCKHCGVAQVEVQESASRMLLFEKGFRMACIYYFALLALCAVTNLIEDREDYVWLLIADVVFAVWTMAFAATQWREILPLFSIRNLRISLLVPLSVAAVIGSLAVGFLVTNINVILFETSYTYYLLFAGLPYSRLLFILSLAVVPALAEELGFRGYMYSVFSSFTSPRNAILISSLAFAILHLNVLSLFWLVPFSLGLGYLRYRYNTLWYGIFIHFFFNLTVALHELYDYGLLPFGLNQ